MSEQQHCTCRCVPRDVPSDDCPLHGDEPLRSQAVAAGMAARYREIQAKAHSLSFAQLVQELDDRDIRVTVKPSPENGVSYVLSTQLP